MAAPSPSPHRPFDVLEPDFAGIREFHADFPVHLTVHNVRGKDATDRRLALQPGGEIDPISEYVLALDDDLAEIEADPQFDPRLGRRIALTHRPLNCKGAFDRINGAAELRQGPVPHHLHDTPTPRSDSRVEDIGPDLPQRRKRCCLIAPHQTTVAGDVRGKDRGEPACDVRFGHAGPRPGLHGPVYRQPGCAPRKSGSRDLSQCSVQRQRLRSNVRLRAKSDLYGWIGEVAFAPKTELVWLHAGVRFRAHLGQIVRVTAAPKADLARAAQ
jgi:hypothetical protein